MADAVINGTRLAIYIGGVKVAGSTSNSLSMTHSTRDATSKDSGGFAEMFEGLRDWNIDGEGFLALDAAYGYSDLVALWQSRGTVQIRVSTETSGEEYHEGTARITDLSQDAAVEDSATFSFSFQGTGALNYKALT